MINEDLFEPFERLVEIEICGKTFEVPENNPLLRCFQYISLETISYGDFCWNGECANCQIWFSTENGEKPVLACRTDVREGMKIVKMNKEISLESLEGQESQESQRNFKNFKDSQDFLDFLDFLDSVFRHT